MGGRISPVFRNAHHSAFDRVAMREQAKASVRAAPLGTLYSGVNSSALAARLFFRIDNGARPAPNRRLRQERRQPPKTRAANGRVALRLPALLRKRRIAP